MILLISLGQVPSPSFFTAQKGTLVIYEIPKRQERGERKRSQALYYCDTGTWLRPYHSATIKLKVPVWYGCEGPHKAVGVSLETEVLALILLAHHRTGFIPIGLSVIYLFI